MIQPPVYLPKDLLICVATNLPKYLLTYLPKCLPYYLSKYLLTYIFQQLPFYLSRYLHIYLYAYLYTCIHFYMSAYPLYTNIYLTIHPSKVTYYYNNYLFVYLCKTDLFRCLFKYPTTYKHTQQIYTNVIT